MIDTDKYEGHTPAPWFPPDFGGEGLLDNKGRVMALLVYDEEEPQTSDEWLANAQLIADVPLLLEEVKRLHVEVRALRKAQGYDMKFPVEVLVIDEYMSENRQLRKEKETYLACIHASQFKDKPGSAMSMLNQMLFLQRSDER